MKNKKIIIISYILYLIMLTWIIVFKFRLDLSSLKYIRSINLVPFKSNGAVNGYSEIFINLMLFIPVGIYVRLIFKEKSNLINCVHIISISIIYEILQYVFHIGVSDITDVIMNSLGGIVGMVFISLVLKVLSKLIADEKKLYILLEILSLLGIVLLLVSLFFM